MQSSPGQSDGDKDLALAGNVAKQVAIGEGENGESESRKCFLSTGSDKISRQIDIPALTNSVVMGQCFVFGFFSFLLCLLAGGQLPFEVNYSVKLESLLSFILASLPHCLAR